jgi:threonine dehydratase
MKGIENNFTFFLFLFIRMFISAGRPVLTECQSTLADGLAVPMIGANAFATAAPLIDKVVIVRLVFISQQKKKIILNCI